ncbi:hypothetical protein A2U01_0097492, partial [Trifolium medium]|nr:hypothetical protein [Trifolium medium]
MQGIIIFRRLDESSVSN